MFLRSSPMQFLGIVSYSVYLLHALLFRIVKASVDAFVGQPRIIPNMSSTNALLAFAGHLVLLLLLA